MDIKSLKNSTYKILGSSDIYPGKNNGYKIEVSTKGIKESYIDHFAPKAEWNLYLKIQDLYENTIPHSEATILLDLISKFGDEKYDNGSTDESMYHSEDI